MNKFLIFPILLLILLTMGIAFASDNATADIVLKDDTTFENIETPVMETNESSQSIEDDTVPLKTKIETHDVTTYYKEDSELVSYLKDSNDHPISNKKVSIYINSNVYNKITDNLGKVVLKLNFKPNTYSATLKFDGDDNYTASSANAIVKVKKATLTIDTKDYKTYWNSDLFFKAKVTNKITKNPVNGVKVAFKVYYSKNKFKIFYATTDIKGIAKLKRNFKVGSYKVVTTVKKDRAVKSKKSKATLTVKPTAEFGCSSFYVQVSGTESVAGFRRDATNAVTIHIVKYTLNGKPAIKQYKKGSYFFHSITSADGWMAGTGGADNPTINKAIEKLVGKMFKEGKIKKSYLRTIQRYERALGIGHFSIKSPDGKYAAVWSSTIKTGKLKAGQYLDVPNGKSYFRTGAWSKFSKDPVKATIKIGATDAFGVNRRDVTAFHWNATTVEGKTTASLKAYAANDDGHLIGRTTGYLKDDIYFKKTFFSKNRLPKTPSLMLLGVHNFKNIDKFKTQTIVKAPQLTKTVNQTGYFKVSVKNKITKKAINRLILKIKVDSKTYTIKTDENGVAKFNTNKLAAGSYKVAIYTNNIKYSVNLQSKIVVTE